MISFLVAMPNEAEEIIKGFNFFKVEGKENLYFSTSQGETMSLMISGIGKTNAAVAAAKLIDSGSRVIINIGSCGAVGSYKIGEVYIPGKLYDGDFDLSAFGNNTKDPANLGGLSSEHVNSDVICYSVGRFATTPIAVGDYLVEMEAYAAASICKAFKTEFIPIKIVSDKADSNALEDHTQNLAETIRNSIPFIQSVVEKVSL